MRLTDMVSGWFEDIILSNRIIGKEGKQPMGLTLFYLCNAIGCFSFHPAIFLAYQTIASIHSEQNFTMTVSLSLILPKRVSNFNRFSGASDIAFMY